MIEYDPVLIHEIRNGNLKSFELVFKGFYPRLCTYAHSFVKDNDIASDLVKDIFIKWWESRSTVEIHSSVSGYLYKSVHNSCINYHNRELKKHITRNESELNSSLSDIYYPSSDNYPVEKLITEEIEKALKAAIDKLPDQCREIFIMSRIEQLSHAEIADKLNISTNTVKVHIYRALDKIRKDLKDYLPFLLLLGSNYFSE
jgi:RNA polymerase sigma-70 factor, ECF subfamily